MVKAKVTAIVTKRSLVTEMAMEILTVTVKVTYNLIVTVMVIVIVTVAINDQ